MDAKLRVPELAELANLDLKRFIDIEMGTVKPTSGELRAIAEALNTTIADILGLPIRLRVKLAPTIAADMEKKGTL